MSNHRLLARAFFSALLAAVVLLIGDVQTQQHVSTDITDAIAQLTSDYKQLVRRIDQADGRFTEFTTALPHRFGELANQFDFMTELMAKANLSAACSHQLFYLLLSLQKGELWSLRG